MTVKTPILVKGNAEDKEKFDPNETLTFNTSFASKVIRITIKPQRVAAKKTDVEQDNL